MGAELHVGHHGGCSPVTMAICDTHKTLIFIVMPEPIPFKFLHMIESISKNHHTTQHCNWLSLRPVSQTCI